MSLNLILNFSISLKNHIKNKSLAITTCIDAIDYYRGTLSQGSYTKNVGIRGFSGGRKTWCMTYCALYAVSKGLRVTTTAMMAKRALQIGGTH